MGKKEKPSAIVMTDGNREIIRKLLSEYDIQTAQDRKSTFAPQIIPKRQKNISGIDRKIISMYGRGLSTRQISDTIEELYGFEVSDSFVSDVTDKILPQIQEWQTRPLEEVYPVVFIDATHYAVRDNGVVRKLAAYVILAINYDGRKEVLSIKIGENESAKYWLGVLNSLKNHGLKDILILCADGLTGLKDAVATAFPQTEFQRCIVHQVRNTLKYVATKDRKNFAADLKKIYTSQDEPTADRICDEVELKWAKKYPHAMKSWRNEWQCQEFCVIRIVDLTPFFQRKIFRVP